MDTHELKIAITVIMLELGEKKWGCCSSKLKRKGNKGSSPIQIMHYSATHLLFNDH